MGRSRLSSTALTLDVFRLRHFASSVTAGLAADLSDQILADSPCVYYRQNDASGTTAASMLGSSYDGTYTSVDLGQTALYGGGPTTALYNNSSDALLCSLGSWPGAVTNMTIMCLVQFADLSGQHSLLSRDQGGGTRYWQMRSNGDDLEFVKIIGGVDVVTKTDCLSTGTPLLIHMTISSGGAVEFFINGASVHTASIGGTDYGGGVTDLKFGNSSGVGAGFSGTAGDIAIFPSVLSSSRILAHAQSAGLA